MEEKVMIDPYGTKRVHILVECKNSKCKKPFWLVKKNSSDKGNFCSHKCFFEYKSDSRNILVNCSYCGKEFRKKLSSFKNSKSELYFCCREHKDLAQKINNGILKIPSYKDGRYNYKERALDFYGRKCNRCGFDDEECLEVHHKDGNRKNGAISNLEVLCANCHRKITNEQNRNRASGVIENTGILHIPVGGL